MTEQNSCYHHTIANFYSWSQVQWSISDRTVAKLVTRQCSFFSTYFEGYWPQLSLIRSCLPSNKTWQWLESEPAITPKLFATYLIVQEREEKWECLTIREVQLPCALLASGACTLPVAIHHIPLPPQASNVQNHLLMAQLWIHKLQRKESLHDTQQTRLCSPLSSWSGPTPRVEGLQCQNQGYQCRDRENPLK